MYVIWNHADGLYWNNLDGWCDGIENATRFSADERRFMLLPIDGQWKRLS